MKKVRIGTRIKILKDETGNGSCWKKGDIVYVREIANDRNPDGYYCCSEVNKGPGDNSGWIPLLPKGTWKVDSPQREEDTIPTFNNDLFRRFIQAAKKCDAVIIKDPKHVDVVYGNNDFKMAPNFEDDENTELVFKAGRYEIGFSSFFSHRLKGLKQPTRKGSFNLMINDTEDSDPPMIISFLSE